jgi:hypothetical protein
MTADDTPKVPGPDALSSDPAALERTGQLLKAAGLPFEDEEFEGESARDLEEQGMDPETGTTPAAPQVDDAGRG